MSEDSAMRSGAKKVCHFVFDTWYGAVVCWCVGLGVLALTAVTYADSHMRLLDFELAIVGVLTVLVLVVAVSFLFRHRAQWALKTLFAFFVCAIVGLHVLAFCSVVLMCSEKGKAKYSEGQMPWSASEISAEIPFAVEFRSAHPFFSEYDRRILFRSGKRIGLNVDTGGHREFAVYALGPNEYYIVDSVNEDFHSADHDEYRVNVETETVERRCARYVWVRVPDESLEISSWSGSWASLTVKTETGMKTSEVWQPVADTLERRKFIGRIYPSAKVTIGGREPTVALPPEERWSAGGASSGLPFACELLPRRDGAYARRVRFRSGKTMRLFADRGKDARTLVFRLRDGRYLLEQRHWLDEFRDCYRVDLERETVECADEGLWFSVPEGQVGDSSRIDAVDAGDGRKKYVLTVMTAKGPAQGVEAGRLDKVHLGATYLGYYCGTEFRRSESDSAFSRNLERAKRSGEAWKGDEQKAKLVEMCEKLNRDDPLFLGRYCKASSGWELVDSAAEASKICAYRILCAGEETCEIKIDLSKEPRYCIRTKDRCDNPNAMTCAAAWTLIDELASFREKTGKK